MFARTRDANDAHLTIVFTGLSLRRVLRTPKSLRSATFEINGITTTIAPALSPDDEALLKALETPAARR